MISQSTTKTMYKMTEQRFVTISNAIAVISMGLGETAVLDRL
jgi:hypothetical protein